jgi:ribosomal-protein-alanine N-acetyltransferase
MRCMPPTAPSTSKAIRFGEHLEGARVSLRLVELSDCNDRYEAWLADPEVNRYLETRWQPQTAESIRAFVTAMQADPWSYLFCILDRAQGHHVGNIKLGPISPRHACADVSYFIGERSCWGKGLATEAISLVVDFGFRLLGLNRIQAGVYESNQGSVKALERNGFRAEGCWRSQLRSGDVWEDHLWFGLLRREWQAMRPDGHAAAAR